jgi:hypothetical protein
MLMPALGGVGIATIAWFLPKLLRRRANFRPLPAALYGTPAAPALLVMWSWIEFGLKLGAGTGLGRRTQLAYALVAAGLMTVFSGAVAAFEAFWDNGLE